jgi:pyruvate/2-oxoacid:ferredoxin oxidoreductase alpha subunit/pyruvate/2-oxoacid:ferredoxin oxidoreductase beta subunit/Pyruvate/2-oxoacid:ferredoxin oxidoreductase gamma subunit
MPKAISNGNIALVNGAIVWAMESAGLTAKEGEKLMFAAGYPITPVNEVTEYLGRISQIVNASFIQAESEIAAGNMVLGAASVGIPALTVTSSPGISLMQEAISYAAGMELGGRGLVYVDVVRGGPGLGNIQGAQSDFNQAVLGGGHGDYQNIVLAPASAQEMFDFVREAFRLSYQYKIPGFILSDGYVGQLKEEYQIPDKIRPFNAVISKDVQTSIYVREGILEEHNWKLLRRFESLKKDSWIEKNAVNAYRLEDPAGPAQIVIVSYGFFSRIGAGIVDRCRAMGLPVGQLSLKVLNPFPEKQISQVVQKFGPLYVMEGGINQLCERIRSVVGHFPIVGACQRPGGTLPDEKEVVADLETLLAKTHEDSFKKNFSNARQVLTSPPVFLVNRGEKFAKIKIENSTYDAEYQAGMDGKRPEPRKAESMTDKNMYFCAGCDHKYSTEALGSAFDGLQDFDITLYSPVGCSIFLYDFFRKDKINNVQVPHGRGPAAASASKRSKPDSLVICYQGDGDALDIGLGELLHASARGEKITVVLINNGTYGMTGGQLSAATPLEQFSKTTPKGRDANVSGFPIDISQMLHRQGVSYYRRTLVGTPELNKQFSHFLMQGILHQFKGDGMSVIEVVATCTEHQRAPQEIIEAFKTSGKKLHQIALAKEYSSTTMPKTFSLAVGWGEDFENPDEVLKEIRDKKTMAQRPPAAEVSFKNFIQNLDAMGILSPDIGTASSGFKEEMRFYLCGEGGQGVQSLADVLMKSGVTRYAYNSPWYEPEVTKARTVAAVTLTNHASTSPNPQPGEVDVLVCMTPQMYFERRHFVKKGGLVIVDGQGMELKNDPFDCTLLNIPAASIATAQIKERRCANMVLLGALNQALEIFSDEVLEKTIRANIPKAADINIQAYRAGKSALSAVKK